MNKLLNTVFFGTLAITACAPLFAFACYQPPKEPEMNKAVFERVFLKCVETVKVPNSLAASGNDMDESIAECRFTARQVAEK